MLINGGGRVRARGSIPREDATSPATPPLVRIMAYIPYSDWHASFLILSLGAWGFESFRRTKGHSNCGGWDDIVHDITRCRGPDVDYLSSLPSLALQCKAVRN